MPNKYLSVDGVATWVHHTGPTTLPERSPDTSVGRTLVCLHDAGGNGAEFAPLLESLSGRHSPFAFDQPGHARSGSFDSLGSIERMAEFSRHLCQKLGLERPVLLGHGMGAAVALRCALDSPGSAGALVLCAGGARLQVSGETLEHTRRVTEGKAQRQFDRSLYASSTGPDVMRACFMESLKTDPRVLYGDYLACRDWDAQERLSEVFVPTLVIVGEEETDALREQADLLCSGIQGARKLEIPKAGHALGQEQPQALADAVGGFLDGLAA